MSEQDDSKAIVHVSSDMQNVTVTATEPEALPHLQTTTLEWCRAKVGVLEAEGRELTEAYEEARTRKWKSSTLKRQVNKNLKRQEFYGKVIGAMEAGYCLFPTTEATIVAVRRRQEPGDSVDFSGLYSNPSPTIQVQAEVLPSGQGHYASSVTSRTHADSVNVGTEEKPRERFELWYSELEAVDFPLVAAKSNLIRKADEAMMVKVFDEIGILPGVAGRWEQTHARTARKGDPVIVGRIIDPTSPHYSRKILSFLIAWYVNTKEL